MRERVTANSPCMCSLGGGGGDCQFTLYMYVWVDEGVTANSPCTCMLGGGGFGFQFTL